MQENNESWRKILTDTDLVTLVHILVVRVTLQLRGSVQDQRIDWSRVTGQAGEQGSVEAMGRFEELASGICGC